MNNAYNKQYPVVRVEKENIEYAKILSLDYASDISEDSAIHLYTYQALILEKTHPEISKTLKHIAITEMKHLELLGKAIHLLGLPPKYVSYTSDNIKQYWTSSFINYTTSLKNMLKQDIKSESMAIENYRKHKETINDAYIKQLLTRIIEDEQVHLSIFQRLLDQQKN